jgi:hypothetical protein
MLRTLLVPFLLAAVSLPAAAVEPKKTSQLVSLTFSAQCGGGDGLVYGQRVMPDGTAVPFAIPAGQVLVVTRVGYRFHTETGATSSIILIERDGAPNWIARVGIAFDAAGDSAGVIELNGVVGAGGQVCVRGAGAPDFVPDIGFVEGYLTKAK